MHDELYVRKGLIHEFLNKFSWTSKVLVNYLWQTQSGGFESLSHRDSEYFIGEVENKSVYSGIASGSGLWVSFSLPLRTLRCHSGTTLRCHSGTASGSYSPVGETLFPVAEVVPEQFVEGPSKPRDLENIILPSKTLRQNSRTSSVNAP